MSLLIKFSQKIYLKTRVREKKIPNISFSSRKWKRIKATKENKSTDYSKCEYLPEKKRKKKYYNSNENMLFLRKTDETIWNPFYLREPPPPFN